MSCKSSFHLHRRQVMRGLLSVAAFGATSKLWTGCSSSTPQAGSGSPATGASGGDKPLVMGFLYVGAKDDYGWNQAHAEGKAGASKVPGIKTVEQDNVPETNDVQEAMRSMIEQEGASVLFPTSFGYFDHILKLAPAYPNVQFFHCGALWKEGMPQNVGSYFADVDDSQYVAGRVAAKTSKTGKLGFIAAKPITPVLRNLNSFMLGARSVKPEIQMQVIFTGDWSLPVKEAEAANSLADQGVDVIAMHVDSPKVIIETAEKRGIFASGFHTVQSVLAPKGYITGTAWDWSSVYSNFAETIKGGKTLMNGGIPHMMRGSLKENFVKLAPYGPAVADTTKTDADATKAKLIDGSLLVYQGEIKSNDGAVKIPKGTSYKIIDPVLDKMDWLASGVLGKVG